jgi:MYXO-CTERM domain-containing protein
MVRYGEFLGDPSLYALAEKQLLWVGGLNTGSGFPSAAVPFSCIVGKGYQWLNDGYGTYGGIAGSIVNGLSATPQFTKQMPTGPEQPLYLCDESWISHTGGWLSGTAALLHAMEGAPVDAGVADAARETGGAVADAPEDARKVVADARNAPLDQGAPPAQGGDDAAVDTSQDEPEAASGCSCRTDARTSAPWGATLALFAVWAARLRKRDA